MNAGCGEDMMLARCWASKCEFEFGEDAKVEDAEAELELGPSPKKRDWPGAGDGESAAASRCKMKGCKSAVRNGI